MGQNKGAACGEAAGGNLYDGAAIDFAHDALNDHLLRKVGLLGESGVELEEVCISVRAECNTTLIGNIVVAHMLHCVEENGVCVVAVNFLGGIVAVLGSSGGESSEHIGVVLGNDYLTNLTGESLTGIGDHLRLNLIALIDDKGETSVLGNGHGLNVTGEVLGSAVTVSTAAGVVHHGDYGNGVNVNGLETGKLVVVVEGHHGLRFLMEALVYSLRISRSKILSTCHSFYTSFLCIYGCGGLGLSNRS